MKTVEIYTTRTCPYCMAARHLLTELGIRFDERDVSGDAEARALMTERAGGRRTVPQIFIGSYHVGGFDDLHDLASNGRLIQLLSA